MPITSFTIGGVEVNPKYESLDIRETVGGTSTLSCEIISTGSPVLRFGVREAVSVQEDGVIIFAGTVMQSREQGLGGPNAYTETGAPEIITTVTAEDYTRLADRMFITETIEEGSPGTTLKDFLTILASVTYLGQLGVSLHASQVDGPTLPAMVFQYVRATDVLQALSDATGFLWRIDYEKKLRMWQAGDLVAPFDIDELDDPASWTDDVEVEEILGDNYANRVIVIADLPEEQGHIETFQGDGVTSTYTLTYTLLLSFGIIHIYELDGITPAGGETFGIKDVDFDAEGDPTQWWYDPATNTITRNIGPTDATKIYSLTFNGFFHAIAVAEDAAAIAAFGLYEHVEIRNDISSVQAAQDLADAILAERLNDIEQIVTYRTRFVAPSLRAGQQQTIEASARGLTGTYIIRDMQVRAETPVTAVFATNGLGLVRTVTAKQEHILVGKWQHTYRDWLKIGKGATGTISIGDGGPSSGGPAPPVESVQYHHPDGGKFAGNALFLFRQTYTTLQVGGSHTAGGHVNVLIGTGHTVV